jgi:hypothetical protein
MVKELTMSVSTNEWFAVAIVIITVLLSVAVLWIEWESGSRVEARDKSKGPDDEQ